MIMLTFVHYVNHVIVNIQQSTAADLATSKGRVGRRMKILHLEDRVGNTEKAPSMSELLLNETENHFH